jgi:hypothetical protein
MPPIGLLALRGGTSRLIDLEIRNDPAFDIRIVERPGRWLPSRALHALIADLRTVVSRGVEEGELEYGVASGSTTHLDNSVVTVIYEKHTRRPIAFNALAILPVTLRGRQEEVLHLGLAMVDPEFRGHGFSWALYGLTVMLVFFRRQMRPIWISNVTQVPAVVGLVDTGFTNVYPSAQSDRRPTFAHLTLARQIMRHHRAAFGVGEDAGFDATRFVITNAYTGGSDNLKKRYDDTAKHRDDAYNALCAEELDYDRGDDFLQLGQYTLGVARRYLTRAVPRHSLPALVVNGAFLFLGSLLLPAIHWFCAGTAMGDIRPARS